jgi:microsomal dipeptidase-like Zn-dependent dipeptidase
MWRPCSGRISRPVFGVWPQAHSGPNRRDIQTAKRTGKTAVIYGFNNASPLEDNLDYVWTFHELWVRIIQLTYSNQNLIESGCLEATDSGLSRYGKLVVCEVNPVGMVVDLSHVGDRTSLDPIEHCTRPVAITHANPYRMFPTPRNRPDTVLKAMAETSGVIGLTPTRWIGSHGGRRIRRDRGRRCSGEARNLGVGRCGSCRRVKTGCPGLVSGTAPE